ncbi:hypothetical protein [Parasitella parasitica]|uniref:Uncharacterized protein n=1 Tax=Parasitella parasitica TaxID=35722 RepID=A0A0B7N2H8_9FUNG|nr:hypothetical protein [Parasitella parasitica]
MKKGLDGLTHIKNLLNNGQTATVLNQEDRMSQLEQDRLNLRTELIKKEELISQCQKNIETKQVKYTQLEEQFNELTQQCKIQLENSLNDLHHSQVKNNDLEKDNKDLRDMVQQLRELYESEVRKKEQLDLLLQVSAQEHKIATEAALERDRKIDDLQQKLDCAQQQIDKQDQLIKTHASKASEEIRQMQEEIALLQQVNKGLSQELEDVKRNQHEEQLQQKDDTSNTISCLEQELMLCQDQLREKKSQNQELESAMERVNEHCEVLRANLSKATEESTARYKKMLSYRDEIRLLKEALHNT